MASPLHRPKAANVAAAALLLTATTILSSCTQAPSTPTGGSSSGTPPASASTSPVSPSSAPSTTPSLPAWPLRVAPAGRYLIDSRGTPFTWIADTAWDLPGRLTREEVLRYLDARARQGFTVIQTVALFRTGAPPNAYGDRPIDGSVDRPIQTPGADPADPTSYDYWDHLDFIITAAQERGLTVALWPAWSANHAGRALQVGNARGYGEFMGRRYQGRPIVWVMGGDNATPHHDIWKALADGIRAGTVGAPPMVSYHPVGAKSSVGAFPEADFEMVQTSHCVKDGYPPLVRTTWNSSKKPVLDAEPLYEDHPWCWDANQGFATADQVRAQEYWAVFSGAFGASYGHASVWQFYQPGKTAPDAQARVPWSEALQAPAAGQMGYLAQLLRARPVDQRIPDDTLIRSDRGSGWGRVVAIRDGAGRYLMAYLPRGGTVQLDLARLPGTRVWVTWFTPRDGSMSAAQVVEKSAASALRAPGQVSEGQDWVVIVDAIPAAGPTPSSAPARG